MLTMQMTAPRKDSDGPVLAMHIGFAHAENDCWHVEVSYCTWSLVNLACVISHFLILEMLCCERSAPQNWVYLAHGRVNKLYNDRHMQCHGVQKQEGYFQPGG